MQTNIEALLPETAVQPIEARDLVRIFFKRLWVLPVMTTICVATGILTILLWTPSFESSVRMMVVGTPRTQSFFYGDNPARGEFMSDTYAELIKNQDVLRDVVLTLHLQDRDTKSYDSSFKRRALHLSDLALGQYKRLKTWYATHIQHQAVTVEPEDTTMKAVEALAESVTAEGVEKSDVINIKVSDPDPAMAAKIANTLAQAYTLFNLRQQLIESSMKYGPDHPVNRQIKDAIATVSSRLGNFDPAVKTDFGAGNVKIVQHAFAPTQHAKPKRKYLLLGSLLGGLLGSAFLIFLLEKIDPTYGSTDAVRQDLNFPFIGAVPAKIWNRQRRLSGKGSENEFYLEALLPLAYRIQTLRATQGVRSICFSATQMSGNDGKLAQALAFCLSRLDAEEQEGKACKVLLVESDAKKKKGNLLSKSLVAAGSTQKSMADYVEGQAELDQAIVPIDDLLSVTTLNGSKPSAIHALQESKYRSFLKTAQSDYELILFQGAAYTRRVDFTFLSSLCDATVLIIDEGRTRKKAVASMLKDLEMSQTKVLGVIVNNQKHYIPQFLYNWL